MYSNEDLRTLHGFLRATGEGNLKKMLIGGGFSEIHLRILLKVARAVSDTEFVRHFEEMSYPKVKFSPTESAVKEQFWFECAEACLKVGLLSKAGAKAA
jgi:hypothetical protein